MAQTFLVFDFGTNEEAAQQARHRIDGWKQGFRLGNKLQFKFERETADSEAEASKTKSDYAPEDKAKKKNAGAGKSEGETKGPVRLFVRLDFSNHEKNLFQTWLKRIPGDDPFKSVKSEVIRANEDGFGKTSEIYDSLLPEPTWANSRSDLIGAARSFRICKRFGPAKRKTAHGPANQRQKQQSSTPRSITASTATP